MKTANTYSAGFKNFFRQGSFSYYSALLLMAIMPMYYRYIPPVMILLIIGFIIEVLSEKKYKLKFTSGYNVLLFLFGVFFFWQIITILYTQDEHLGWLNIFGRLSLIIFPLVLFNPGEKIRFNRYRLLRTFSLATTIFVSVCFLYAFYRSVSFNYGNLIFNPVPSDAYWSNYFFEYDFTLSMHPSYLGMFVLISSLISFESFYDNKLKKSFRRLWFIDGIFLLGSLYFISSRAAILAGLIVILIYGVIKIFRSRQSRFLWTAFLCILIFMVPLLRTNDKVNNLVSVLLKDKFSMQDERVTVWKSSLNLIKQNPFFGVGVGDVRSELTKEYFRAGENEIGNERLNAHNQFLEVLLEGGIIQLIFFLAIFTNMILLSVREKNLLYGLFIIMTIIFFLFETVLYRLAGIAFFSLFSFILLKYPVQKRI